MLLNYFNLRDQPFGVTPDPRYLFLTKTHREALEGLLYGIHSGLGFIALTAEPGMGKTTLLRMALNRLGNTAKTVFLFQTITNPTELFRALLMDLGEKDPPGTLVDLETRLNEILLRHNEGGQRVVVVLDEAQNLDDSVLEAIRMLSNFETSRHKLLQVILCGQHQLADRLATPELVQLRQRISIYARLKPLTRRETADYIDHRLKVAEYGNSTPLFTPEAVSLIAHYADGIPRNINNICFNSLSTACALGKKVIDAEVVREVIVDLRLEGSKFADPTDDLSWQGAAFAESTEDVGWQEEKLGEPFVDPGLQEATFAEPAVDLDRRRARLAEVMDGLGLPETRFAEPQPRFSEMNDVPSLQKARFAELADDPGLPETRFADSTDDLDRQRPRFAETSADSSLQKARFAELADDPGLPETRFAESSDAPGWRETGFAKPVRHSEHDEDESKDSDLSEQRETSPGLRVAVIATLVCATVLAILGWNAARSGGPASPLMSQVTSWFHDSPPVNNQSQVQAPKLPQTPPTPQVDHPTKTPIRRHESSTQTANPSQDDAANHERSGAYSRTSRVTIPNGGVTAVRARQDQSVAGICVERFNGCTPELLNTIVELNPDIKDQDHLEAGERIFVPVIGSLPQQSY